MIPGIEERLTGVYPVLPTPFHDDQSIDLDGLGEIIDRLLAKGISGITVLGSGAESAYLTDEERYEVLGHAAKRVAGRATVIAGLIQFGTRSAVEQGKRFKDLGADALLLGLPQPYDMPLVQVIGHFTAIVRDVMLPTLYYHPPRPAHLCLTPEQVGRLFADVSLVGVQNASADATQVREQILAIGRPISMFTSSSLECLDCLRAGGVGAMCAIALLMPVTALRLVAEYRAGNDDAAAVAQERLREAVPIVSPESGDVGVVGVPHWGVKEVLAAAGILKSAAIRHPQPGLSDERRRQIRALADRIVEL